MSSKQTTSSPTLLSLPSELRDQIWTYAFGNLDLWSVQPSSHLVHTCAACRREWNQTFHLGLNIDVNESTSSVPSSTPTPTPTPQSIPQQSSLQSVTYPLYTTHFLPLLTNKQIHHEASSIFYTTLRLHLADPTQLVNLRHTTAYSLRSKPTSLTLYIHLTDATRQTWHSALTTLTPTTFPSVRRVTVNNHMRSPTSYDRLVDAIYIAGPLSIPPFSSAPTSDTSTSHPHPQPPPSSSPRISLTLQSEYTNPETLFESPLLGPITTSDSIDTHRDVVRAVMSDPGFQAAALANDWEAMPARLLAVARQFEEGWLEALQRRRLGGLTVHEIQAAAAGREREERERGRRDGDDAGEDGDGGEEARRRRREQEQERREVT